MSKKIIKIRELVAALQMYIKIIIVKIAMITLSVLIISTRVVIGTQVTK